MSNKEIITIEDLERSSELELLGLAKEVREPEVQRLLATFPNVLVRGALAGNPNLEDEVFELLKADESEHVQLAIRSLRESRGKLELVDVVKETRDKIGGNGND